MSYEAGEAQILALIQGIAGNVWNASNSFSLANDSTRNTDAILNSGVDHHYVVLYPAPFRREWMTIGDTDVHNAWKTEIAIFEVDDPQIGPVYQLAADRAAIIAQLDKYGKLSGTPSGVYSALVVEGDGIKLQTTSQQIAFQSTRIRIEWHEDQAITQLD